MNQDWREERIKELFNELRREDEHLAPPFARDWAAALSRTRNRRSWPVFRAVAAGLMLILLGGALFVFFRQTSPQPAPAVASAPVRPIAESQPAPDLNAPRAELKKDLREAQPKIIRHLRLPARPRQSQVLISQWRPPTDFLLKYPGEQLLKTVPKLGDSPAEIMRVTSEE